MFRLQQVAGLQAAVADLEATVQLCEVAVRSTCSKCVQSAVRSSRCHCVPMEKTPVDSQKQLCKIAVKIDLQAIVWSAVVYPGPVDGQ